MELFAPEYYDFIFAHSKDDVTRLRMKYHNIIPNKILDSILVQIEGRRKFSTKLRSILKNPKVIIPSISIGEQATNSEVAEFHASLCQQNGRVLDMTAGMGVDAFAFSKSGCKVVAIDMNEDAVVAGLHNAEVLGLKDITFILGDSVEYLKNCNEKFSLIFIDPMRRNNERRFYALKDCSPDITNILSLLKSHSSRVIIKASPMLDIYSVVNQLKYISRLLVVSHNSECKEILIDLNFDLSADNSPQISAIDLKKEKCEIFHGNLGVKKSLTVSYLDISEIDELINNENAYLYEPNPSIMKAGLWNALPYSDDELRLLSPNTHLFIGKEYIEDFPGRKFKVLSHLDKRGIKVLKGERRNVLVRNYPLTADALRKKIGVKDGGDNFIIGIRVGCAQVPAIFDTIRI